MIAEFIITFREALEVSLIVGIILAYLERSGNHRYERHVYLGMAAGLVASVFVGLVFQDFSSNLAAWGIKKELFEGVVIALAALMITWMILWMLEHGRHLRREIERKIATQINRGYALGLALFTFLSVLREGFETVIFLGAAAFSAGGVSAWGALGGIAAAVVLAFLLFEFAMKINLRLFFNATSVLLIIFAAGLVAHAVHEFQEAGAIPEQEPLWSTKAVLDENGVLGGVAHALTGYDDSPTPYQVLGWLAYYAVFALLYANLKKLHPLMRLRTGA
ncbi:MAG: FTR1 family protein [Candidatus Micrarchaeia archaeon]